MSAKQFYLTIDPRSLGLFRITAALVLIADWILRWPCIEAFYTSAGVLPIDAPLGKVGGEFHFSLLDTATSVVTARIMFLAALAAYAAFLVGYRTRIATILTCIFYISIVNRNIMIRNGGHMVLASLLVWSLFLPLGARFSIDALRRARATRTGRDSLAEAAEPSLAALGGVLQIAIIYALTAASKAGHTWWDGTAVFYALQVDHWTSEFGRLIADGPGWLIRGLTWSSLAIEYAAAPLILVPAFQPSLRRIAIICLTSMHLGIAACMNLGIFSFVMIASFSLLLMPQDWDLIDRSWRRVAATLGIRLKAPDVEHPARHGLSRSRLEGRGRNVAPNHGVRSSRAGNTVSDRSAINPQMALTRWLKELAIAVILVAVLADAYNNSHLARRWDRVQLPTALNAIVQYFQIGQDWDMFAPDPTQVNGWWVVEGFTESGRRLDPLTGHEPRFDRNFQVGEARGALWNIYLYRLSWKKYANCRGYFARYLTRTNHRSSGVGDWLVAFDIHYVSQPTVRFERRSDPSAIAPLARTKVWQHECLPANRAPTQSQTGSAE